MESGNLIASTDVLLRCFVLALYVPVGLVVYRRLIPFLSPTAKRLAGFLLLAQVLAIVIALEIEPNSGFERWLWHLNAEWNIPATLSSTQMALVGGVALATAWLANRRPIWQRLYLVAIGLVFVFLAHDEYSNLHEYVRNWERQYAALGAVVVLVTLVVAFRSPRHSWKWHICLLTGLAMSAFGALAVEQLKYDGICRSLGALSLDGCLWRYYVEEPLEILGIWLVLVAMLGQLSELSPPSRRVRRALYLLPPLWILLLFQTTAIIPIPHQTGAQPAAVAFESEVNLHGFRIEHGKRDIRLHLFLSPSRWDYNGLGFSVHMVDQVNGESVASRDKYADVQLDFFLAPRLCASISAMD